MNEARNPNMGTWFSDAEVAAIGRLVEASFALWAAGPESTEAVGRWGLALGDPVLVNLRNRSGWADADWAEYVQQRHEEERSRGRGDGREGGT
jgi:hypothetical protein